MRDNQMSMDGCPYGEPCEAEIQRLQDEVERLRRIKSEWEDVVKPAHDYVDENEIARLGHSKISELVESHKQLKQRAEQLQRDLDEMSGWVGRAMMKGCCNEDITKEALQKYIDERDTEQQIKALEDLLNSESGYLQTEEGQFAYYDYEIQGRIEQLRKGGE